MNSPSSSKRKTPIKGEQVITKFFTPNSSHSRPGIFGTLKSTSCPTHAAENRRDRHGSGGHLTAKKSHLKPESGADNHSKKSPISSRHGHHHHHHRHHHHGHRRHRESESCSHKESSSKSAKHSDKRSRSHSRSSDRSEGQHKSSLPRRHSGSTGHTRDPGLSDNSDDDDLLKPPAALLPLSSSSEATPKPKKKPNVTSITPSANTVESENEMIDLSQSSETDQYSGVKLTITLDMLLEEKKATDLLREELEDKGEELKEFIRQGGIDNLSITTNGEL
ncbi:hypothetical protein LSAT2_022280 [Lamellibrachia satsuma]|nr:hypothetical protein LSAT2_022280 [Lamellibrachia satsuma]